MYRSWARIRSELADDGDNCDDDDDDDNDDDDDDGDGDGNDDDEGVEEGQMSSLVDSGREFRNVSSLSSFICSSSLSL